MSQLNQELNKTKANCSAFVFCKYKWQKPATTAIITPQGYKQ